MNKSKEDEFSHSIQRSFKKIHDDYERSAKNKCRDCECSCEYLEENHNKTQCCLCSGITSDDSCSQCNERHYCIFGW